MRSLALLSALAVTFMAASGGDRMTNAPGTVQIDSGGKFFGDFHIKVAGPGEPALANSVGTGGACLIAQFPVVPRSCRSDDECNVWGAVALKYNGYCVRDEKPRAVKVGQVMDNSSKTLEVVVPRGTCWVKPSEAFCLKGKPTGDWSTPPADAKNFVAATKVKNWRVYTCLNGDPGACKGDTTANGRPGKALHRAGIVYTAN
jgi:hypothetical protein